MSEPIHRGRPRREPKVITSVRIPVSTYDRFAHRAIVTGESVHATLLQALQSQAARLRDPERPK